MQLPPPQYKIKDGLMADINQVQKLIEKVCDGVKELLIKKNAAYGNSAIEPLRIFSKSDSIEQINVRIDDKISRIARGIDTD